MAVDQMKRIALMASNMGYHDLAESARALKLADPPVKPEYRQSLITTLKSAMQARDEDREQQSVRRSRVLMRAASPKLEFKTIKNPTLKLREKIAWITSFTSR